MTKEYMQFMLQEFLWWQMVYETDQPTYSCQQSSMLYEYIWVDTQPLPILPTINHYLSSCGNLPYC